MNNAIPPRRLTIIHNPTAGTRSTQALSAVLTALEGAGARVTTVPTARRGHAEVLAQELGAAIAAQGADRIPSALIAAGGDGTINEVVNGLARLDQPPPLGIIPLGTANVLARELGVLLPPDRLARVLATGPVGRLHPGRCTDADGASRLFVQMLGAGLDARAVAGVTLPTKRRFGKGAYVWQGLRQMALGAPLAFEVELVPADGTAPLQEVVSSVVFAKGRFYGGGFVLAPKARADHPVLHACLFRQGGRGAAAAAMAALGLGMMDKVPGFRILPVTLARVTALYPDGAAEPVQGDGDILATVPVTVDLAPRSIPVIVAPSE